MSTFTLNQKIYHYNKIEKSLSRLDLLSWLDRQTLYPKFFWKSKNSDVEIGAVGEILSMETLPDFEGNDHPSIHFFGGFAFSKKKPSDSLWSEFPKCFFFLPAFEIIQNNQETKLIAHLLDSKENPPTFDQLLFDEDSSYKNLSPPDTAKKFRLKKRIDYPDFEEWKLSIQQALRKIELKDFQKVILARKSSFLFDSSPSTNKNVLPFSILKQIIHDSKRTTYFGIQLSPKTGFIGATPEKLYMRIFDQIQTEAIAGTRKRGISLEEDLFLEEELKKSEKEMQEFLFVKEFISQALSSLCENFETDSQINILKTTSVQHLHVAFSGNLKKNSTDKEILTLLHPTPALGGFPQKAAINYIEDVESFDRGWYGAPIGWISPHHADFAVAIRSCLIQEKKIHLFSGLGIVKGSQADSEWEELEHKIEQFRFLFKES